jgi:sigma-B regulation protein RsbU (phosphoserine phosphatase)
MATVLLSYPLNLDVAGVRRTLGDAGFTVADHVLGSTPAVDFGPVAAAVVVAGERADSAAAQTRRWRIELGDELVPILWLIPCGSPQLAVDGLEAGADAAQLLSVEPAILVAQLRAMVRNQAIANRLKEKAGESRLLGEQLRKAYLQLDRESDLGRRVHRGALPRELPQQEPVRFALCRRPQNQGGCDFFDVRRLDEEHIGFFLGGVMGHGGSAALLGILVQRAAKMKEISGNRYRLIPPEEILAIVNRELIGLGLTEPPLVAMLAGVVNTRDGALSAARAGMPAPVFLPAAGDCRYWEVPGPYLGAAATSYSPHGGVLCPGDKLLLASDGACPATPADRLLAVAARHRALSGQQFVDALSCDLLQVSCPPTDITLLAIERSW